MFHFSSDRRQGGRHEPGAPCLLDDGHHHGFGHRNRRRIRGDHGAREGSQPEGLDLTMEAEASGRPQAVVAAGEAVRIFVCTGGGCCDGRQGGRALIDALQREIAAAGPDAARIDVRPCGCLDQCEKGPVAVAYGGGAAQASRPPRRLLDKLMHRPIGTFFRATPAEARRIVDTFMRKRS